MTSAINSIPAIMASHCLISRLARAAMSPPEVASTVLGLYERFEGQVAHQGSDNLSSSGTQAVPSSRS